MVLFKAGIHPTGLLRGKNTHIFGTDLPSDKHLRAAASGILAGLIGSTDGFVTGGAEQQTPPGGSLIATISKVV